MRIGYQAGYRNTTGASNTIVGHQAGGTNTIHSKTGNVFLGYQAGYSDITGNKLYIENSNSTTPLIYGDFAADALTINGSLSLPV